MQNLSYEWTSYVDAQSIGKRRGLLLNKSLVHTTALGVEDCIRKQAAQVECL